MAQAALGNAANRKLFDVVVVVVVVAIVIIIILVVAIVYAR